MSKLKNWRGLCIIAATAIIMRRFEVAKLLRHQSHISNYKLRRNRVMHETTAVIGVSACCAIVK
jgi:hypothetical protein